MREQFTLTLKNLPRASPWKTAHLDLVAKADTYPQHRRLLQAGKWGLWPIQRKYVKNGSTIRDNTVAGVQTITSHYYLEFEHLSGTVNYYRIDEAQNFIQKFIYIYNTYIYITANNELTTLEGMANRIGLEDVELDLNHTHYFEGSFGTFKVVFEAKAVRSMRDFDHALNVKVESLRIDNLNTTQVATGDGNVQISSGNSRRMSYDHPIWLKHLCKGILHWSRGDITTCERFVKTNVTLDGDDKCVPDPLMRIWGECGYFEDKLSSVMDCEETLEIVRDFVNYRESLFFSGYRSLTQSELMQAPSRVVSTDCIDEPGCPPESYL